MADVKCSGCGVKLSIVEQGRVHRYGSPIRQCPRCARSYVDRNYHEIEIEGIRESDISLKKSLGITLFCLILCIACVAAIIFLYAYRSPNAIFVKKPTVFILGALLFGLGFFVMVGDTVKILTGARKRELEKERQESVKRLSNREYVLMLQQLGYKIPEKYL